MTDFDCLEPHDLEAFLERRRASPALGLDMSLAETLTEILRKANEFVPSKAGAILLDNPKEKSVERQRNTLTFIAAFGSSSAKLLGREIPAEEGVAGQVYRSGEARGATGKDDEQMIYRGFDELDDYQTSSLVAIPVRIEKDVCGVLELVNRVGADGYSQQDVNLLEIFAGYISISIQNVLDGRQAQEIAKRDNLTGLHNDRYLHITLSRAIATCRQKEQDLTLLFLDLDFFKRVNDTHGHLAGSQVLQEVGRLLGDATAELAGRDVIAARYGGDEFVVALPDVTLDAGIEIAEAIRKEIVATTFCAAPGEIQPDVLSLNGITCSIGVASLSLHLGDELSVERCKSSLLRLADSAMYVAKETGRNRTASAARPVPRDNSEPA